MPRNFGFQSLTEHTCPISTKHIRRQIRYVLQHSSGSTGIAGDGMIYRVAASDVAAGVMDSLECTRDVTTRIAADISLKRPTSIVVGPDGFLYVTNKGLTPGDGEVLRIVP